VKLRRWFLPAFLCVAALVCLWVMVPGAQGKMTEWGLEGMSPSYLGRRGWNSKTLTPGDKITIVYYPLKDGRPGGFYVRVTLPDGHTVDALPQRSG